jgi:hypothetical protein
MSSNEKDFIKINYINNSSSNDIYCVFYEKALSLLKLEGYLGFITSNSFMRSGYGEKLRKYLSDNSALLNIFNFGDNQFFEGATTRTSIIVLKKYISKNYKTLFFELKSGIKISNLNELINEYAVEIDCKLISNNEWSFNTVLINIEKRINDNCISLNDYVKGEVYRGILTGFNKAFIIDKNTLEKIISVEPKAKHLIKPIIAGRDIFRYGMNNTEHYLINTQYDIDIEHEYPNLFNYFLQYKSELEKRLDKGKNWYNLRACSFYDKFEIPKIIFANMAQSNRFVFDKTGIYTNQKAFIIPIDDLYLLSILNSKMIMFFVKNKFPKLLGDTYEFSYTNYVSKLPIPILSKESKEPFIALADAMLEKNKELHDIRNEVLTFIKTIFGIEKPSTKLQNWYELEYNEFLSELTKAKVKIPLEEQLSWQSLFAKQKALAQELKSKIEETDKKIDSMVYELYGLTEEEIRIVEGS